MSIVKDFIGILKWGQSISTWANTSYYYVNYNVEKGALSSVAAATWCRLIFQTTKHIFSKNYYYLSTDWKQRFSLWLGFTYFTPFIVVYELTDTILLSLRVLLLLLPTLSYTDDCSPILSGLEGTMQGSSKDLYWF